MSDLICPDCRGRGYRYFENGMKEYEPCITCCGYGAMLSRPEDSPKVGDKVTGSGITHSIITSVIVPGQTYTVRKGRPRIRKEKEQGK